MIDPLYIVNVVYGRSSLDAAAVGAAGHLITIDSARVFVTPKMGDVSSSRHTLATLRRYRHICNKV